jgi:hypothetical protein
LSNTGKRRLRALPGSGAGAGESVAGTLSDALAERSLEALAIEPSWAGAASSSEDDDSQPTPEEVSAYVQAIHKVLRSEASRTAWLMGFLMGSALRETPESA